VATLNEEWQAEIERLKCDYSCPEGGVTVGELAGELGVGRSTARTIAENGVESGRYTKSFGVRIDASGRKQRVPVYHVVKQEKPDDR